MGFATSQITRSFASHSALNIRTARAPDIGYEQAGVWYLLWLLSRLYPWGVYHLHVKGSFNCLIPMPLGPTTDSFPQQCRGFSHAG